MSASTPADGSATATNPIIQTFKELVGFDLNTILSLADPETSKVAKDLAEKMKGNLPKNHFLRSGVANRLLAVLSSRVEKVAKHHSKAAQDVADKLSDFINNFRDHFFEKEEGDETKTSKSPTQVKETDTVALLEVRFLKNAEEMIRNARFKDIPKIEAGLAVEFKALMKFKALVKKELEPKPEPKKREVTLAQQLRPVNADLKTTIKKWKSIARKLKRKTPVRKANFFEKIVDFPSKVAWNFLMPK